jgi:hypothetical protein
MAASHSSDSDKSLPEGHTPSTSDPNLPKIQRVKFHFIFTQTYSYDTPF